MVKTQTLANSSLCPFNLTINFVTREIDKARGEVSEKQFKL
jgi:hypothetical protein